MSDLMNIHDTVYDAVPNEARGYTHYIDAVVDALVDREQRIMDNLTTIAMTYGLSGTDADRLLVEAGFVDTAITPATTLEEKAEDEALDKVRAMIADLADALGDVLGRH